MFLFHPGFAGVVQACQLPQIEHQTRSFYGTRSGPTGFHFGDFGSAEMAYQFQSKDRGFIV